MRQTRGEASSQSVSGATVEERPGEPGGGPDGGTEDEVGKAQ